MLEADYFAKKRQDLGMTREASLEQVQDYLEHLYPGQVRAKQIHKGVLRLQTTSAPVAGAIRMRQLEIMTAIGAMSLDDPIERLQITIA